MTGSLGDDTFCRKPCSAKFYLSEARRGSNRQDLQPSLFSSLEALTSLNKELRPLFNSARQKLLRDTFCCSVAAQLRGDNFDPREKRHININFLLWLTSRWPWDKRLVVPGLTGPKSYVLASKHRKYKLVPLVNRRVVPGLSRLSKSLCVQTLCAFSLPYLKEEEWHLLWGKGNLGGILRDNLGEGDCESKIAARQWGVNLLVCQDLGFFLAKYSAEKTKCIDVSQPSNQGNERNWR